MATRAVQRLFLTFVMSSWLAVSQASTDSTEITDQWWNPGESGWGVNVTLQSNTAFLTFFVYDTAQNPVWYTAAAYRTDQPTFIWNGTLYATTGPWFGGPFPPANVNRRQVGSVSFAVATNNLDQATLTYTIDGVTVSKTLERQTWALENLTGAYTGGYSIRTTACNPSSRDGVQEVAGALTITQRGQSISIVAASSNASCVFSGAYSQTGKLGRVQGTYSCTDGTLGAFVMGQMTPTVTGFSGRIFGQDQFCQWSGNFGGIYRTQ